MTTTKYTKYTKEDGDTDRSFVFVYFVVESLSGHDQSQLTALTVLLATDLHALFRPVALRRVNRQAADATRIEHGRGERSLETFGVVTLQIRWV